MFGDVREFCKFKKYIDSRNPKYKEKSTILDRSRVQPKQRDVALMVAKLIFLIIFVTSCYVLNKIAILSEIQCPGDLRPPPGRKSSQEIEIDSETIPKPLNIEEMRKPRKTRQNLRIHRFFDFKHAFSLC